MDQFTKGLTDIKTSIKGQINALVEKKIELTPGPGRETNATAKYIEALEAQLEKIDELLVLAKDMAARNS